MAENTKIEWADDTFNPWIGCTKVAPECKNCYAETRMDKRLKKVKWGPNDTRVLTSAANWKKPLQWDKAAAAAGVKRRVFCASLADVFEENMAVEPCEVRGIFDLDEARAALWTLIKKTPNLIWLLLTKRPENILEMVPLSWSLCRWPANVWTGTSAGCQETADKNIPALLQVPGPHFLSCEPLLGPVDLTAIKQTVTDGFFGDCLQWYHRGLCHEQAGIEYPRIDGVIAGGESGPGARPMHPEHVRSLRDQCVSAGVAFFFKQWGEWLPGESTPESGTAYTSCATGKTLVVKGSPARENFGTDADRHSGHLATLRVGKAKAGRMLDGRTWDEMPKAFGEEK